MPDPAWFTSLSGWWSFEAVTYDNVSGTLVDHSGSGHDGNFQIRPVVTGVNATQIVGYEPGGTPPWACSKGAAIDSDLFPAIITNRDLDGSLPTGLQVPYAGGTPWYSTSSWSMAIWVKADAPGTYIGVWDSGHAYAIGDVVTASDLQVYIATATTTGNDPTTDGAVHWHLSDCSYPVSDLTFSTFALMTVFGDEVSNGAARNGWRVHTTDGKEMLFSSTTTSDLSLGKSLPDGQWHLYVVTSDGTTITGYRDDAIVTGTVTHAGFGVAGNGPIWGSRNVSGPGDVQYAQPWNGEWADTMTWDRVLSSDDIHNLYIGTDCVQGIKIKNKFFAKRAPDANEFTRAAHIKYTGACQVVPWDVAGLTVQSGEPTGANVLALHQTRWFEYIPSADAEVTFYTAGTPADDYSQSPGNDADLYETLAIWTGSSLGALSEVDSVDDAQAGLTVSLTAFTSYKIQVGTGKQGCNGMATLAWF